MTKRKPTKPRTKVVKAWAVVDMRDGYIWEAYIRRTRTIAISQFIRDTGWSWVQWRHRKTACVRVLISIAPSKGKRRCT